MPSQTGSIDLTSQNSASKTATNYITADADGIKIHMTGESSTYQYQTATDTTFYISGKKRTKVGSDGLHIYVDTNESQIASFTSSGSIVGKTAGSHFAQDATTATFYGTNGTDKNLSIETYNGVGVIKFNGDRSSINGFANILGLRSYGSSDSTDNGMITITAESEDVNTASGSVGLAYLDLYSDPGVAHAELASYDNSGNFATVYVDGKNNAVDITGDLRLVNNVLSPSFGGTGKTSLQATRSAMGLGNTTGALPVANGGTGKTTAADARTALGAAHNVWTSLGSVSGTTSLTIDLTNYNEVLITCRYSTTYLSSIVLPKAGINASTQWEIYLGGWGNNSTTSNRRAVAKLSRVKFTPVVVTTDQTDRTSSSTWVVYAR